MKARVDGPCSLIQCLCSEAHEHDVCPDCGALEHGNLFCSSCAAHLASLGTVPAIAWFMAQLQDSVRTTQEAAYAWLQAHDN